MLNLRQPGKGNGTTGLADGKDSDLKQLSEARRRFSNGRKQIDCLAEKTIMLEMLHNTKKY